MDKAFKEMDFWTIRKSPVSFHSSLAEPGRTHRDLYASCLQRLEALFYPALLPSIIR